MIVAATMAVSQVRATLQSSEAVVDCKYTQGLLSLLSASDVASKVDEYNGRSKGLRIYQDDPTINFFRGRIRVTLELQSPLRLKSEGSEGGCPVTGPSQAAHTYAPANGQAGVRRNQSPGLISFPGTPSSSPRPNRSGTPYDFVL